MTTSSKKAHAALFSAHAIAEGKRLAEEGTLTRLIPTDEGYVGQLRGGGESRSVAIHLEGPRRPGECPCDDEAPGCAHLWAAGIHLERLLREGNVPARESLASRSAERLKRLRSRITRHARTAWDLVEEDDSKVVFRLPLSENLGAESVTLRVARRTRKASGSFGAAKPMDLRFLDFDEVAGDLDRRLLGLLGYGIATRGADSRDWRLNKDEHALSQEQAREVLPQLCAQGRLELGPGNDGPQDGEPVIMEQGAPWRIELKTEDSRMEPDSFLVSGELARGPGERLPSTEIRLVLPSGLAFTSTRLMVIEPVEAANVLDEIAIHGAITVVPDNQADFHGLMAALPQGVFQGPLPGEAKDNGPQANTLPEVRELFVPHLAVALATGSSAKSARLECEITFDYGATTTPRPESRHTALVHRVTGAPLRRDPDGEAERLRQYMEVGGRRSKTHRELGNDGNIPAGELPKIARQLLDQGWRVTADKKPFRSSSFSSVSVESGIDWFDLSGALHFGDQEVPLPELLQAAKSGAESVELGDGSRGMLPEDWLKSWGLLGVGEKAAGDAIRFKKSQGWLLDALLEARATEGQRETLDGVFEAYRKKLGSFTKIKSKKEPRGFQGELRGYQREALGWFHFLRELGLGGCLADDMGLGKTVQVLALLESRRTRKVDADTGRVPSMVVAPKSLVFNWIDEAARFAPKLRVVDFTGSDRHARLAETEAPDLLVTTYGSLRRDAADLEGASFDYLILDEATAIKNASSQAAKAARLVRAEHRLALSGTPVENNLFELWSLFEFLNPGMLGRSSVFRGFVESTRARALPEADKADQVLGDITRAIRPFFLRRTKSDVLTELPEKSEQVLHVELSPKDRKRYDDLRQHFRKELLGPEDSGAQGDGEPLDADKMNVLTALLRLRQAACHPGLIDEALAPEDSAKLEVLLPRLEELCREGHKVLVFSQFTSLLAIVRSRLSDRGIRFEYLDGQTQKRKEVVARFQKREDIPVFLISLKAGGHGLNLTQSDYVFLLDPWWNPAIESQAIDRAHRMGQERPVFAYRVIAKNTVEERVLELQAKKRSLADALFDGGTSVLKGLTRDDLDGLLS